MPALDDIPDAIALRRIQTALWGDGESQGAAVMVGAGFSRFARRAAPDGPPPPLWSDLEKVMRQRLYGDGGGGSSDPLRLAEEYEAALGRTALDAFIRARVDDPSLTPGALHTKLVALPWSDILTTNWDTLLERAAANYPERAYTPVLAMRDIAGARAPRVVKLHGSLPSNGPFILTEEDFRQYPRESALFVNLAQQVLVENVLCLVGFSGDDPNFLKWSGWVRDHLGAHTPTIFLVGALDLSSAKRSMLQQRHVSPVDLSPALKDVPPERRHEEAMRLFLDALREARPPARHGWPRYLKEDRGPEREKDLPAIAERWATDRAAYPGWVAAPSGARRSLHHDTAREMVNKPKLDALDPPARHRVVYELAWRKAITLEGLPEWLAPHLKAAIDSGALSEAEQTEGLTWLTQHARERGLVSEFQAAVKGLEAAQGPDALASAAYERALWARDNLDFTALSKEIALVEGNDPIWRLRQAALFAELEDEKATVEGARAALRELRQRQAQARHSIWVASRLSWALFVCRTYGRFGEHKVPEEERGDDEHESWPAHLTTIHCNPWTEREALQRDLTEALAASKQPVTEVRQMFDPGAIRTMRRMAGYGSEAAWAAHRFLELTGLPRAVGGFALAAPMVADAAHLTSIATAQDILRLAGAACGQPKLVEELLPRLTVARLNQAAVNEAASALRTAVPFALGKVFPRDQAGRFDRTSMDWGSNARVYADVLSRLVMRLTPEEVETIFMEATGWLRRVPDDYSSPEDIGRLLKRCLMALPKASLGKLLLLVLELPVAEIEEPLVRSGREMPDLIDEIPDEVDVDRAMDAGRWSTRIEKLLHFAARVGGTREDAIRRLRKLHLVGVLTADETARFGEVLWRRRKTDTGEPEDTGLLPSALLTMPEPEAGLVSGVYKKLSAPDVKLDARGNLVRALTHFYNPKVNPNPVPLSPADALAWFERLARWRAPPQRPHDLFPSDAHWTEEELGEVLAWMVAPSLNPADLTADHLASLANPGAARTLCFGFPAIAKIRPDWAETAADHLRQHIAAAQEVSGDTALRAVTEWAALAEGGGPPLPADLTSAVATATLSRGPTLRMALHAARVLVEAGRSSETDLNRLDQALAYLLGQLDYGNEASEQVSQLGLTRAAAVRLARALKKHRRKTATVQRWLEIAQTDPLPEVRISLDEAVEA